MEEQILYIKEKLNQSSNDETNALLDIVNAFAAIELALQPILEILPANAIQDRTERFRRALAVMVSEFEENKGFKGQEILQFNLEPSFQSWKAELEKELSSYTLS